MEKTSFGRVGEKLARQYLEQKGYHFWIAISEQPIVKLT